MQQSTRQIFICFFILSVLTQTYNSSLSITGPSELKSILPDRIHGKYSVFGNYKYGFKTDAQLVYHPMENIASIDADYACKPLNEIKSEIAQLPNTTTSVVMVDRGSCTFVTKMRNIQAIGAQIALIVNDRMDDDLVYAMNDDGTGKDITIPGLMISKAEGEKIKNFIKANKNATITVNVDNTINDIKTNQVAFEVNFIANDRKVYQMLQNLKKNQALITDVEQVKFVPNYVTVTHPEYDANNFNKKLTENNNCICGGRYCSYGHNFFGDSFLNTINSQDVIVESVRQKCIYNLSFNTYNNHNLYFDYMNNFADDCLNSDKFTIECSRSVIKGLKRDELFEATETCFKNSFVVEFDSRIGTSDLAVDLRHECKLNNVLEMDKEATNGKIKEVLPVVFINNHTLYGTWNADNVLEAVCANLKHKPESCYTNLNNVFDDSSRDTFTLSNSQLIAFAVFIIVLNVGILFYCKRYMGKKAVSSFLDDSAINAKIGTIVSGYLKMKDTN